MMPRRPDTSAEPAEEDESPSPVRLKILLVSSRFLPSDGGVQRHVKNLAEQLCAAGHEVTVWTHLLDDSPEFETIAARSSSTRVGDWGNDGGDGADHGGDGARYSVRRFPLTIRYRHALVSRSLRAALRSETDAFDIVHVHGYHDSPLAWMHRTKHRRVMVTPHFHGTSDGALRALLHRPYRRLIASTLGSASIVGCVSAAEESAFAEAFPEMADRCVRTTNGVSVQPSTVVPFRPRRTRTMTYVGRLEQYKRVDLAIEALARLNDSANRDSGDLDSGDLDSANLDSATGDQPSGDQPAGEHWVLEIVGDGPHRAELEALARRRGVAHSVTFHGYLDDARLAQVVAASTVGISMSEHEAQGIVLFEFLGRGIPVVAASIPAFVEIAAFSDAQDGVGGVQLVAPSRDVGSVAEAANLAAGRKAPRGGWKVPTCQDAAASVELAYRRMLAA